MMLVMTSMPAAELTKISTVSDFTAFQEQPCRCCRQENADSVLDGGILIRSYAVDSAALRWMALAGCLALIGSSAACTVATADARIIDEYKEASCVPMSAARHVPAPAREWHAPLSFDGGRIVVKGAQIPGGSVTVWDSTSNREFTAADPGDYIYPSDVRFNARTGVLYTKAHGLAAGITETTLLFKYELRRHEITERMQIRNDVLPPECEATDVGVVP